jgi:hypothetical protein
VKDTTEQRLALTDRVWVPPMKYTSIAPYLQLSYDIGPVTLSGGVRREDGELEVDDYTTTFFRNRAFVEGGKLDYKTTCSTPVRSGASPATGRCTPRTARAYAAEHRHPPAQHQRAGPVGRRHPRPRGDHLRQQGSGLQLARRPRQLRRLVLQVDRPTSALR